MPLLELPMYCVYQAAVSYSCQVFQGHGKVALLLLAIYSTHAFRNITIRKYSNIKSLTKYITDILNLHNKLKQLLQFSLKNYKLVTLNNCIYNT